METILTPEMQELIEKQLPSQMCEILKEKLNNFELLERRKEHLEEECVEMNIIKIPPWIINNERHIGIKSLKELKDLANC